MKGDGTHKYHGRWTWLDHFYLSPSIDSLSHAQVYDAEWIMETDEKYLGLKPKRTYNGYTYQNGYSDHLPIFLHLIMKTKSLAMERKLVHTCGVSVILRIMKELLILH